MSFPPKVREEALVRSRRCCCICHEFAGVFTNVHHIRPSADGGTNELANAIVLCLRCHGEVGHYNPKHPIGNKYTEAELVRHRDEWWKWCAEHPEEPLPREPVAVSPSVLDLSGGDWTHTSTIKIHNKADRPYYGVYVKVGLPSTVDPNCVKCQLVGGRRELVGRLGEVAVDFYVVACIGKDSTGNPAHYLIISSIDPGETVTLSVTVERDESIESKSLPINIAIAQFEVNPIRVAHQGHKTAYPIKLPEEFEVQSMRVLMKRVI